jgi:hypothetical protein
MPEQIDGRHRVGSRSFDTSHLEWREVRGEPGLSYKLRYDLCVLGWDRENGTIDFVLRFAGDGGHCQRHRHLATTARAEPLVRAGRIPA